MARQETQTSSLSMTLVTTRINVSGLIFRDVRLNRETIPSLNRRIIMMTVTRTDELELPIDAYKQRATRYVRKADEKRQRELPGAGAPPEVQEER